MRYSRAWRVCVRACVRACVCVHMRPCACQASTEEHGSSASPCSTVSGRCSMISRRPCVLRGVLPVSVGYAVLRCAVRVGARQVWLGGVGGPRAGRGQLQGGGVSMVTSLCCCSQQRVPHEGDECGSLRCLCCTGRESDSSVRIISRSAQSKRIRSSVRRPQGGCPKQWMPLPTQFQGIPLVRPAWLCIDSEDSKASSVYAGGKERKRGAWSWCCPPDSFQARGRWLNDRNPESGVRQDSRDQR
jgi:hypothetical protein